MRRAVVLLCLLAGCDEPTPGSDNMTPFDASIPDVGAASDLPAPLRSAFTVSGCASLDTSSGAPRCSGRAPLAVTFVAIGRGVDTLLWTFPGGAPASASATSQTVTFAAAGIYTVTLAAGGGGGTSTSSGTIIVSTGATGAPCLGDGDCDHDSGLSCLCKPGEPGCVGALALGLCTRECASGLCAPGEICADLTRGANQPGPDGGVGSGQERWRRAVCLPSCASGACSDALLCRDLPSLSAGGQPGGAYSWRRGCFASVGGDDGTACLGADGLPDASRCLSGRCELYGARGLCTSPCASNLDCPSTAACATFSGPPASHACLSRCTMAAACDRDPLLDCEAAGAAGALGFHVDASEAASARYCAPRRCASDADCAPAGSCKSAGGGSFCVAA